MDTSSKEPVIVNNNSFQNNFEYDENIVTKKIKQTKQIIVKTDAEKNKIVKKNVFDDIENNPFFFQ